MISSENTKLQFESESLVGLNPDVRTFFSAELKHFKGERIFTEYHCRLFTGHVVARENTSHFFSGSHATNSRSVCVVH